MKGLDVSISLIIVLLVGIAVILVLSTILSGNIGGLQEFATQSIAGTGGIHN
jgi:hypothetical protein